MLGVNFYSNIPNMTLNTGGNPPPFSPSEKNLEKFLKILPIWEGIPPKFGFFRLTGVIFCCKMSLEKGGSYADKGQEDCSDDHEWRTAENKGRR